MATTITGPEQVDVGRVEDRDAFTTRSPEEASRRRFTIGVVTGTALAMLPMLWLLWDLWSGKVNVIRGVSFDYFYDRQARAMFHGHLWVPPGQLSIEAFVHGGHQFTYFGIFPSLIRMPILLFTSRLDGDLTAPSLLLAWFATAIFTALLLWRLRILIRGTALVGRAEAASYGVLMAGVMAGSVVIFLTATPFVYNEDFAWSIPLVLGSLFALLGMQERPSWGRAAAAAVLVVCTNLNRTPGGYAVTIGCILVAAWFALGKGGTAARRWAIPLVAIGLVGFLLNAAVNYAKFGVPVGLPLQDQVWTQLNAYRRHFLSANGGKPENLDHIPAQLWAYFQPFGVRFSTLFPFITPPGSPASGLGAVMELTYPTASMTTTAPLFIVLGVWGTVTAFRRRGPGRVRMARLDPGHRGRGDGRGRRLGIHLPAVYLGLHAFLHRRVCARHDRSLAPPRGPQPQGTGMGARGPRRARRLWGRRQRRRRGVAGPAIYANADGRVRVRGAVAEHRLPRCQRSDRSSASVLGSLGRTVRGRPLLRPLPVER